MRSPIVVGVDGSAAAASALRWAVDEADRRTLPVRAVLAWSDDGHTDADAALALEAYVTRTLGPDAAIDRLIVRDDPVPALVTQTEEATLVVVGARGAEGFLDLHLGSTTHGLLRHATAPVAVVRGPGGEGPVVVGVDGSPGSDAALRWAVEETRLRGGALEAVIAWQRPPVARWVLPDDSPQFAKRAHEAEQALEDALVRVDTGSVTVARSVVEGSASGALIAASRSASVLVVGARGRGVVAEPSLGSVSLQVVHHALGPVVVVPDPWR